jgi:hypothetical protein
VATSPRLGRKPFTKSAASRPRRKRFTHSAAAGPRLTDPSTSEIVKVNRLRRKRVNPAAPGIREPAAPERVNPAAPGIREPAAPEKGGGEPPAAQPRRGRVHELGRSPVTFPAGSRSQAEGLFTTSGRRPVHDLRPKACSPFPGAARPPFPLAPPARRPPFTVHLPRRRRFTFPAAMTFKTRSSTEVGTSRCRVTALLDALRCSRGSRADSYRLWYYLHHADHE